MPGETNISWCQHGKEREDCSHCIATETLANAQTRERMEVELRALRAKIFAVEKKPVPDPGLPLHWPDGSVSNCHVDAATGHIIVGTIPAHIARKMAL